ncbi:MAG: DUF4252 domain-containing protein [Saprospiraceae bacterium]|nr:DUF4252 domain-containing protein [Saprospiraceae bacterium]
MKFQRVLLPIFIIILSISAYGQKNIDQILRKYKNDTGVVNLNFTGDITKYLKSSNVNLESTVDDADVFIFENQKDISTNDQEAIRLTLDKHKFESLLDFKNKDQKVKLYVLDTGKYLSKVYANVKTKDSNIYILLSGKIKPEELSKLNLNFEGSEVFKQLDSGK